MKEEIEAAVCLMSRLAGRSKRLASGDAERFGRALGKRLAARFLHHWYPERPSRGQAYRCIRVNTTQRDDPVLVAACGDAGLHLADLCLPRELTLWVDPCEVCCRYGERNHAFTVARFDTAADRYAAALARGAAAANEEEEDEEGEEEEEESLRADSAISSLWPSSSSSSTPSPSSDEEDAAAAGGGAAERYAAPVMPAAAPHAGAALGPPPVHFQRPEAHYQQVTELVYHPLFMWPAHPSSYPALRRHPPPAVLQAGLVLGGGGGGGGGAAPPSTACPSAGHFLGPSFLANATAAAAASSSPSGGKMRRGPNRAAAAPPPPGFGVHHRAALAGLRQRSIPVAV